MRCLQTGPVTYGVRGSRNTTSFIRLAQCQADFAISARITFIVAA